MNVIDKLRSLGYDSIDASWYTRVDTWNSWYKGNVAKFHDYTVYNGQHRIKCQRYTLGMAKKVCEDWANLLMNEKVKITLEDKAAQEFVDEVFKENEFEVNMNELQEKGAARGTYAVIPRIVNVNIDGNGNVIKGEKIVFDYITADRIFPISWTGRDIKECAFATVVVQGKDKYLYMQIHVKGENGNYKILNKMFNANNDTLQDAQLADVKGYQNVPETVETNSDKPQFFIGRLNIANNIEDDNPMGISVFANAIDILKGLDIAYDSYVNEFVLGKKRVMVQPSVTKKMDGENVFDPNDVTYYVLPEDMTDGSLIQPIDMSLRTPQHQQGIQDQLNLLSAKCGFGEQHYKFDQGSIATATQIVSENSEMFRTIKKHETVLESLLVDLCRAILRLGNTYLGKSLDEKVEISIDFDDSIIEDKDSEFNRALTMLSAGLMRPEEARAIIMNEDIDTAKEALPTLMDLTTEGQDEVE